MTASWFFNIRRRLIQAILLFALLPMGTALAQQDTAAASVQVDVAIAAQDAGDALREFALLSDIEILFPAELVAGISTNAVNGRFPAEAALHRMLRGTGLTYRAVGPETYVVEEGELPPDPLAANALAGENTIGQRRPGIEEIIVTGQKREERIQDVPIAISAFSPEDLEAQKIEGGFDLLKGVPNVTFSKTNFSGYNFQIRGIGTQAVSATTDPAVAVSLNNTTLIVNRLFEQEYLDVERVEVLRGPQGTLFGRNATAGVINVISNKPELGVWDGMFDVEVGNYNTRRLRGFINAPIGDDFAVRGAYASTKRDGFGTNLAAYDEDREFGDDVRPDVDGRDLWTGRLTLGWQPNDRFRMDLLWERFEEDDNRVRTSKQLCHHDPGLGNDVFESHEWGNAIVQANTSQGCTAGSLYDDGAYGTPLGTSLPYIAGLFFGPAYGTVGLIGDGQAGIGLNPYWAELDDPAPAPCEARTFSFATFPIDLCQPNPYADPETGEPRRQSRDLRTIYSQLEPEYRAAADIFELSFDFQVTDDVTFTSQTVYATDEYYATQDYNRYTTAPVFNDSLEACGQFEFFGLGFIDCTEADEEFILMAPGFPPIPTGSFDTGRGTYADGFYADLLPGGVFDDPQLGPSNTLVAQDLSEVTSRQFNQEFRVVSDFAAPFNFSLGANVTRFKTQNDYYVFLNAASLITHFFPFNTHLGCYSDPRRSEGGSIIDDPPPCVYVDPNPLGEHNGEGHNYFRSANPYELKSSAIFGELYWRATDTIKLTAGLRMTWDEKRFTPIPSQLLLADYRLNVPEGAGPDQCIAPDPCQLRGSGVDGRGSPPNPDIVQEWREPTGRLVLDWQPDLAFTDESMFYASAARGYKGGGANPPSIAPPAGTLGQTGRGAAPTTFEPEYVNAFEVGTKNTLFNGALVLNGTAFYYDYKDYQVSKIVDRSAANENFDAKTWGAELEVVFAPSLNWQFNAAIGYLDTEIAEGEQSIDLMDRTQGGGQFFITRMDNPDFDPNLDPRPESDYVAGLDAPTDQRFLAFDEWIVMKPWVTYSSNCIAPLALLEPTIDDVGDLNVNFLCPTGNVAGRTYDGESGFGTNPVFGSYIPEAGDAPNNGAGFFADLGGNELPQAPHFTVALGGQYNFDLTRDWRATARVDYYWQDESYARVYNTEYDRLKSWSNTNLSFWVNNPVNGITLEAYVKNVFNETPITGSFLNSDDSGLTTNVFTLDPRLIGVSLRKEF